MEEEIKELIAYQNHDGKVDKILVKLSTGEYMEFVRNPIFNESKWGEYMKQD